MKANLSIVAEASIDPEDIDRVSMIVFLALIQTNPVNYALLYRYLRRVVYRGMIGTYTGIDGYRMDGTYWRDIEQILDSDLGSRMESKAGQQFVRFFRGEITLHELAGNIGTTDLSSGVDGVETLNEAVQSYEKQ